MESFGPLKIHSLRCLGQAENYQIEQLGLRRYFSRGYGQMLLNMPRSVKEICTKMG